MISQLGLSGIAVQSGSRFLATQVARRCSIRSTALWDVRTQHPKMPTTTSPSTSPETRRSSSSRQGAASSTGLTLDLVVCTSAVWSLAG